jgi:hypothetical protein
MLGSDRRGDRVAAGLYLGLAVALKWSSALVCVYYLGRRQFATPLVAFGVVAALSAVYATEVGFNSLSGYFTVQMPSAGWHYRDYFYNLSLLTLPGKVFRGTSDVPFMNSVEAPPLVSHAAWAGPIAVALLVIGLGSLIVEAARSSSISGPLLAAIGLSTILSPIVWPHGFLVLVPCCYVAWLGRAQGAWAVAVTVAIAMIAFNLPHLIVFNTPDPHAAGAIRLIKSSYLTTISYIIMYIVSIIFIIVACVRHR